MTLARPMLADVLARLTVDDNAAAWRLLLDDREREIDSRGVWMGRWPSSIVPWRHPTPAEALAALVESDLVAEHWLDAARAPRWWCESCDGEGDTMRRCEEPVCRSAHDCGTCDCAGYTVDPPSHAALVAVASLGPETLARAEAIIAETWPKRAMVWRVMTAAELNDHGERLYVHRHQPGQSHVPRVAAMERHAGRETPAECDYVGASPEVRRAWPALSALVSRGLHPVDIDVSRVVLAVEGLT